MYGRLDAEKLERFYLSSCTDTAITGNSTHQYFPLVETTNIDDENYDCNDENNNQPSQQNGRDRESKIPRPILTSSSVNARRSRVQVAFHKLYDSLMCLSGQQRNASAQRAANSNRASYIKLSSSADMRMPLSPSMSKEQFMEQLHRLVEDIERKSGCSLPVTNKKSPFTTATPSRTLNTPNDEQPPNDPAPGSLSVKLAIFGFFLIVMFGFAKVSKSI